MEKTVVKAIRVLEALALSPRPRALGEIAAACDMTKSNAHRLLQTLGEMHYVRQVPESRSYEATLRLWEIGMRVFDRFDIRGVASPILQGLQDRTGESVHLSIFDDGDAVYIDRIDSRQAVRAYIRIGDRVPAYCTATGRAMLACLGEAEVAAASRDMRAHTELTVATPEALAAALTEVRRKGYALTRGEWRQGVVGVAAPIRSQTGMVVAGVGVAGPAERMGEDNIAVGIDAVLQAATDISRALGFSSPDRAAAQP
ncbi:MAG: IclR family transcriptional regulator [Proteobacteria bacterium]|nr:IclR family transcriptional regulator [Pseudomonadota bacterium]MDA0951525.1 IclR family transcriptional regulator [Pseudomonadota bacterium]MDA1071586.1 IclR family transcriptional regulator [Pseudomonadota bacterium]